MQVHVEVVATATRIRSDETSVVRLREQNSRLLPRIDVIELKLMCYLLDGDLHVACFVVELSSDEDIRGPRAHGRPRNEAAFDELVRVVAHDLAVLARARLAFVRVHNEVPARVHCD